MPTVYQVACSGCRYVSPLTSEGYLAVIVDKPASPTLSTFVHPEDNRLIILAHPLESKILEELGVPHKAAALGGRLLHIRNLICRACGTSYEIRRLWAGAAACSTCFGFLVVSAGLAAVVYWQSQSLLVSFVAGWLGLWVLSGCRDWRLIARFASGIRSD